MSYIHFYCIVFCFDVPQCNFDFFRLINQLKVVQFEYEPNHSEKKRRENPLKRIRLSMLRPTGLFLL